MFSITLTIHNKEYLLPYVLESIKKNTVSNYEFNIVVDGCSDNSELVVDNFIKNNKKLKINKFQTPDVFETKANNVGLKNSNEDYCIIIQDDMIINEYGWEKRLIKPINTYSDVFAVTAQCAHNWVFNPNSKHQYLIEDLDDCWCDILQHTEHANRSTIDRDTFAVRDSANRGPLLIKHDILKSVGYLDETFAPQDMDDHDLCYKVYKKFGLVAGCYWLDIVSDNSWGGTRATGRPASWLLKSNHKNVKTVWQRHKELILAKKHNENRFLKE